MARGRQDQRGQLPDALQGRQPTKIGEVRRANKAVEHYAAKRGEVHR